MLTGLVPVLLTPMTKSSDLDYDGLENLVRYLSEHKITSVWALGSAGEEINIGLEKKIAFARAVSDVCEEYKLSPLVGTGCVSLEDHYRFIDETSDCKFNGIHVLPYDLKMGKGRTINLYTSLANYSPWPVWMYHNPKRGRSFELSTVEELSAHVNIGGIKFGGYNLSDITKCFMLKSERFDVVAAGSGQLFACLALGADAHTTSEGCVYPYLFNEIIRLFKAQDYDLALELQRRWITLNATINRTDNGEHAAEEKYLLSRLGICSDYVNQNYITYPKENREHLDIFHSRVMDLCDF